MYFGTELINQEWLRLMTSSKAHYLDIDFNNRIAERKGCILVYYVCRLSERASERMGGWLIKLWYVNYGQEQNTRIVLVLPGRSTNT